MELKYGDRVKVISGFFRDYTGKTTDYEQGIDAYWVALNLTAKTGQWFKIEELEKIEEKS